MAPPCQGYDEQVNRILDSLNCIQGCVSGYRGLGEEHDPS